MRGTHVAPPARNGRVLSALSPATTSLRGQFAVPANRNGRIAAALAQLGQSLRGSTQGNIATSSLVFVTNTANNNESARLLALPPTFGVDEFTLELRIWPDNTIAFGDTSVTGSTNQRTLWSNNNTTMYGSSDWWFPGNFLLDGHNNSSGFSNGTLSAQINNSGRPQLLFGDGVSASARPGGLHGLRASKVVVDGQPHTITFVRRANGAGSIFELWVDGVLEDTETSATRPNMAATYWSSWSGYPSGQQGWFFGGEKQACIGAFSQYEDYKGRLGEIRFWSLARSAAQIAADWNRPIETSASGLVGLYRFNEGAGTTSADLKGNGGNVTLVPGAGGQQVAWSYGLFSEAVPSNQSFLTGVPTNVPLVAPQGHATPFYSDGTPLPSGVSISGSNLVWSGAGSPGNTSGHIIRATPVPSAEADWLARSTAAGVVFTERFDSLNVGPGAGGGRYYNGNFGQRGFRDTTGPRVSGTGSLRLEHRPGENSANMTGSYTRFLVDGGGLLPQFGAGQVFYMQLRYRIDTNWFNNIPTWGGSGKKIMILHQRDISCGSIELSLQHYTAYSTRMWHVYTGCGTPGLFTNTTNPNNQQAPPLLLNQRWNIDGGAPYQEVAGYRQVYNDPLTGFAPQANIWYTIDWRIVLPNPWGASNCRVEAWVTAAGQSVRQKFIAWIGPMFSNGEPTSVMDNFTLTGYLTGGANNASTTGSCWYDEVIVSTQPIALPTATPVSG